MVDHAGGAQVGIKLVTVIVEQQRPLAVGDDNPGTGWHGEFCFGHAISLGNRDGAGHDLPGVSCCYFRFAALGAIMTIGLPAQMLCGDGIMGVVFAFPLLIFALAVYNIMAFTAPASLDQPAFELAMLSSVVLHASWGDLVIVSGLLLLAIEIMKASQMATPPVVHNVLASLVFLMALAEMVLVEQAATATFFILVVICLINVIAGLAIATRPGHRTLAARPAY